MRRIYILLLLITTSFSAFAEPQTWSAYFAQKKALLAGYVKSASSRLGLWTFAQEKKPRRFTRAKIKKLEKEIIHNPSLFTERKAVKMRLIRWTSMREKKSEPFAIDEIEKNLKQAYCLFCSGETDLSNHPLKKMWQKNKRALNLTWKSKDPKKNLFNVIEIFLNEAERYNQIAKEKTSEKRREDFLNKEKGFVCLDIVDSSYNRALRLMGKARQDIFDQNRLIKNENTTDQTPSLVLPILAGYTVVGIASYCAAPYIFKALQESDTYTPEIKTLAAGLAVSAMLAHHTVPSQQISQ